MTPIKDYPGAKNGSGIIPWLINEIPYHERYYELCAGSASLFFKKKEASYSHLNDINPSVYKQLKESVPADTFVSNIPVLSCLQCIPFRRTDFLNLDPPYHEDDRRSGAVIYDYEMMGDSDHIQLLTAIQDLNANIMISSGQNKLYELHLKNWRRLEFETMGHKGKRVEVIYMNYPPPVLLHEYTHLGKDYIQRQSLNRKRQRWHNMLKSLPDYQKHVLIQELIANDYAAVQHFMAVAAGKQSLK